MASLVVNRGLQQVGEIASAVSSAPAIQTISVDDRVTAFVAGDTSLGSPTNEFDKAFDSTPTRSGQVITHVATLATTEGNMTIRRIALHNDTPANVNGSTTTLICGIDNQSIVKNSTFTLQLTIDITYTAV